jgi:hypothetical protein
LNATLRDGRRSVANDKSGVINFIEGELDQVGDPDAIIMAVTITKQRYSRIRAQREADLEALSRSDLECLDEAIAFCRPFETIPRGFSALSNLTHLEKAWRTAATNGPMDYEAMIDDDNPAGEQIIQEAAEFAAYGVL